MNTYCFEIMQIIHRQGRFKTVKLNYTYNGMEATLADTFDGQLYHIDIKPLYATVNKDTLNEAII